MNHRIPLAIVAALLLAGPTQTARAQQDGGDCDKAKGTGRCVIQVKELRPTQFTVGGTAVNCKRMKLSKKSREELDDYLDSPSRVMPTIIGPAGNFYITDRHHTSTALFYSENKGKWVGKNQKVHLDVKASYYEADKDKRMSMKKFWVEEMVHSSQPRAWPYKDNKRVPDKDLAKAYAKMTDMGDLVDDPFRTLSRWVRESCGYLKKGKEACEKLFGQGHDLPIADFMEFLWANYMRTRVKLPKDYTVDQLKAAYPQALWSLRKEKAIRSFFDEQNWDDPLKSYGFNPAKFSLFLSINKHGCEKDPKLAW